MVADVVTIPPLHIEVTAYVRACGFDALPDTYYLLSFPTEVQRVGVGDRLIMQVGTPPHSSSYNVTLKYIRGRAQTVVEFVGNCTQLPLNLCYVQVAAPHARISRFAFCDLLRGRLKLTDSIPAPRLTPPWSPIMPSPEYTPVLRPSSIEVYVSVELSYESDSEWEESSVLEEA